MNRTMLSTLLVLATSALFAQNVAIIDMDSLLRNHPNTPNDKKQVELTLQDYSTERDTLRKELESKDAAIGNIIKEIQNPMFGEEKKKQLGEEGEKLRQQLIADTQAAEQKMQQRSRDLQDLESRLIKRTGEDIQAVVKEYAEKRGYDVVYFKAAVVYAKESVDITKQIQAVVDAKKASAATAEAKKAVAAAKPAIAAEKKALSK